MKRVIFIFFIIIITTCNQNSANEGSVKMLNNNNQLLVISNWSLNYLIIVTNEKSEILFKDMKNNEELFYKYEISNNSFILTDGINKYGMFSFFIPIDKKIKFEIEKKLFDDEEILSYIYINKNKVLLNLDRYPYMANEEVYLGIYNGIKIERINLKYDNKNIDSFCGDYSSTWISYNKNSENVYFVGVYRNDNSENMVFKYNLKTKKVYLIYISSYGKISTVFRIPNTNIIVFYEYEKGLVFYRDTVPED
jgi:hypothetical protein